MEQEELKVAEWGKALGQCFELESLDLAGNQHVSDEFFHHLGNQEKVEEGITTKPGLAKLVNVKMSFLINITDSAVQRIT